MDRPKGNPLESQLDQSLVRLTGEKNEKRFGERRYLREALSGYLSEYPFIAADLNTLRRLRNALSKPIETPGTRRLAAAGVFGMADDVQEERDKQLREILEQAKPQRDYGPTPPESYTKRSPWGPK